jgi:GR25 family glycosyltransferase involved in LPS biosynthesis
MENTKFKIFIISIERNKNRYTSLLTKLKEQGFNDNIIEVFIGIDYKKDNIPSKVISPWGKYTPKGVLACAASHVLLWNYISKQDLDFALILEDDSYVIKNEFEQYFSDFKRVINDETFLNLSTSFIIQEGKSDNLFTESLVILALDTYMLTPGLCKKLFEFYKNNGLAYHIDLHLTFIKKYIPMKLLHFNKKITVGNMRLESSMVQTHDKKFFLKLIKDTESYKELNTPIIEYQGIVFNAYHIIMFIIFILILALTFLIVKKISDINIYNFLYLSSLWTLLGFGIYDMI